MPGVTTQVATFQVVNTSGCTTGCWAPIVLFLGTDIVSIYIFLQFIRSIPRSSTRPPCSKARATSVIFWSIIFPLLKPAIATVVIIKGFAAYNEFYIPFLYMPSRDLRVHLHLAVPVHRPLRRAVGGDFGGRGHRDRPDPRDFLFLQRYIYNGYTQGAVK